MSKLRSVVEFVSHHFTDKPNIDSFLSWLNVFQRAQLRPSWLHRAWCCDFFSGLCWPQKPHKLLLYLTFLYSMHMCRLNIIFFFRNSTVKMNIYISFTHLESNILKWAFSGDFQSYLFTPISQGFPWTACCVEAGKVRGCSPTVLWKLRRALFRVLFVCSESWSGTM